jgi:hypothetical protein
LNIRRVAIVGVAVFAAAGLIAGCASKNGTNTAASPTAKASPSPTVAPREALLASTKSLATTSYKYTIKSADFTGSGAADPANKLVSLTATGQQDNTSIKLDFIAVGTDLYAKLDFGPLSSQLGIQIDKYMHLDATKLGAKPSLPIGISGDPLNAAGILAGLNDATTTDGKTFTGTVDATKMTGDNVPDPDVVQKAGDKAKAIPFTAVLDDQGRLTSLKVDGASIDPQLTLEATISDYGSAAGVTKPAAAQVVEAPDAVVKLFQGS